MWRNLPRANGAKRHFGRKPGARVLLSPGYFFYTREIKTAGKFAAARGNHSTEIALAVELYVIWKFLGM